MYECIIWQDAMIVSDILRAHILHHILSRGHHNHIRALYLLLINFVICSLHASWIITRHNKHSVYSTLQYPVRVHRILYIVVYHTHTVYQAAHMSRVRDMRYNPDCQCPYVRYTDYPTLPQCLWILQTGTQSSNILVYGTGRCSTTLSLIHSMITAIRLYHKYSMRNICTVICRAHTSWWPVMAWRILRCMHIWCILLCSVTVKDISDTVLLHKLVRTHDSHINMQVYTICGMVVYGVRNRQTHIIIAIASLLAVYSRIHRIQSPTLSHMSPNIIYHISYIIWPDTLRTAYVTASMQWC